MDVPYSLYHECLKLFRKVDLDGDNQPDLLLSRACYLQKNGAFDAAAPIALPPLGEQACCDLWKQSVFIWTRNRLQEITLEHGNWKSLIEQELPWPDDAYLADTLGFGDNPAIPAHGETALFEFARFLNDFENDGIPELVVPVPAGLQLYKKIEGRYVKSTVLDAFPPLQVRAFGQRLWPAAARVIELPHQEMHCDLLLDENRLLVSWSEELYPQQKSFHTTYYEIATESNAYQLRKLRAELSPPLPFQMNARRLNGGGPMDYMGLRRPALPHQPTEILVSTDGGNTVQSFRTVCLEAEPSFVDLDGDGDLDMVANHCRIFEGGVRESVVRFLSSRDIEHEFRLHFQGKDGIFSPAPDGVARLTFRLEARPVSEPVRLSWYAAGQLWSWKGDFNGDGRRDLLAYDRPERIALYLNHGARLSREPDAIVNVLPYTQFDVDDLNGDGYCDLITMRRENDRFFLRIHLSGKETP